MKEEESEKLLATFVKKLKNIFLFNAIEVMSGMRQTKNYNCLIYITSLA